MSLDGIVTRALVHELQACVKARIHKIYQPTENELIMHVRGQGVNGKLLLSAHPSMPRIHWTEQVWANPQEPPMFCMLLRKYCEGGVIESIRQVGLERIVEIEVRHRDELGDSSLKRIVLEIMGRHSNLILMDPISGIIHDGIRHVTPAISSFRVVLPGSAYVSPPSQDKVNPLEQSKAVFEAAVNPLPIGHDDESLNSLSSALLNAYTGISPLIAREIAYRTATRKTEPWLIFDEVMRQAANHEYEPNIVVSEDGKALFSAISLTQAEGDIQTFVSMHECLDTFYREKASRDLVRQRTTDLNRFLLNEMAKNEKKLIKLQDTLQEANEADLVRRSGELLTAHLHAFKRGDKTVDVIDYYEEEQPTRTISLDPLLMPNENAQRYFRKYNKLKNSRAIVTEQLESTTAELKYLASVLQGLEAATPNDIGEIREELIEQGYIRERGAKRGAKKKKKDTPAILCYTSSEGVPIYVGKNNTQNDYVTNRLAMSSDTWLHTKDIPGSHVLIRSAEFGETTLHEAAVLAAYYSKGRESSSVPVDYTRIRNVRKPSGAKPGFVIYDGQKTLYVTPDITLVQRMPATVK
ncbi:Rqc2 family fibronectin-binding protein [Cohnella lupini]|uniref:Rqc2 homolog RqcH n=1 Tax=Cohnella lupini TaxID=1294267 RepID=A0A3D9IW12_9BACL|nr:NFACT RNA binding domain-containing protein [Cohnella lupini]RED65901.1 putative ribosome quality control (RQC) complex YloA/Tae2 family protein [Cohnella lupini]